MNKKINRLCKFRITLFRIEGFFAKLRRNVERKITEEHVKQLDN